MSAFLDTNRSFTMAEVVSLKVLSVTNIITQIWNNKVCLPTFIDYSRKMNERSLFIVKELLNIQKGHHEQMENIFKQIMDLSLPQKTKLRICLAMLNLERDAYTFCKEALSLLKYKKYENILYIMSKLYFTPSGRVDCSRSILKSILDSYGRIEIDYRKLGSCFVWNEIMANVYKKHHKYNSTKKVSKIISKLPYYRINLKDIEAIPTTDTLSEDAVKRANMMFELLYHRICELDHLDFLGLDRTRWLSQMLMHKIFSAFSWETYDKRFKIIFISEKLPQEIWVSVIKVYGNLLVHNFLYSEQIDYCKHFYKQVCMYAPQYCEEILEAAFDKVISYEFEYSTHIFKLVNQESFFYIWFETPADVKNKFIINNYSINSILGFDDYEQISLILKDSALIKENQIYLIDLLTVSYKCYPNNKGHTIVLDKLIKEFRNGSDNIAVDTVKSILERQFFFLHDKIELSITSSEHLVQLKTLVRDDINFVTNVVKYHMDCDFLLSVTEAALKWKYGDNKPELLKYITETFIHTDEFINVLILLEDEIKDWDEQVDVFYEYIIDIFRDPSVRQVMKKKLRTTDLFKKYLRRIIRMEPDQFLIMNKWNPYRKEHKPYFIPDLLTTAEIKQKINSYLMSETGLQDVIQTHIYTDHSDVATVTRARIIESHRTFTLFRMYWLEPYYLNNKFYKYIVKNAKEVFNKHFKPPNIETLLPHQSLEQYETIVNAFYKLFISVVSGRDPETLYERDYEKPWEFLEDTDLSVRSVISILADMNHVPALID